MSSFPNDPRKNPGIKRAYYPLPVEDPTGFRCIELMVPDGPEYIELLRTALKSLTLWYNYSRDESHRGKVIADIFSDALNLPDLEACMNCEDLVACLQPLFDAQRDQILNDIRYGNDSGVTPGTHPPDSQNEQNLAEGLNPDCDKDILWAQATQIVSWMNQLIVDALEIAETATNDTELLEAFGDLPIINELGVASAFGYIDLLQEGVSENYAAQFTDEYAEAYACLIMQACCNDCEITIERLYKVASDRVATHFVDFPTSFATVVDLWAYMSDQDIDGTIIADVLFIMGFGGGFLANAFFAAVSIKPLQIILALAVNDANDDWLILCPDCPEEYTHDFPDAEIWDDWTMEPFANAQTTVVDSKLVGAEDGVPPATDANFLFAEIEVTGDVSSFEFDIAWVDGASGNLAILAVDGSNIAQEELTGTGSLTIAATGSWTGTHTYSILMGVNGGSAATRYTEVSAGRFAGSGTDPFA